MNTAFYVPEPFCRSLTSRFMIKYGTLKDLSGWNVWVPTEFCFHSDYD